jgi:hypothetical protein
LYFGLFGEHYYFKVNKKTLNENQQKAASIVNENLVVFTGAGTGKATTIIQRIAHMIKIVISILKTYCLYPLRATPQSSWYLDY